MEVVPAKILQDSAAVTNTDYPFWPAETDLVYAPVLRYCRNVRPTWVKFNSKDTKESEWCFEVLSTKSKKRT